MSIEREEDPSFRPRSTEPRADDTAPRQAAPGTGFKHALAGVVLRLGGWTPDGAPPALATFVIVAAPHTWWWDSVWMLAFAWWWGLRVRWLLKSSLMRGPLGWFFRALGAIPVDRSASHGLVSTLVEEVARHPALVLAIAPEGTRAHRRWWRSGFYHLAREAKIPLCLSYLDYAKQRGGFGPCFATTDDLGADMDRIRAFYRDVTAKRPERVTAPRLREEDEPPPPAG